MFKTDGYSYKNIVIPTAAGVREYNISTTFANGLPKEAVLVGVFCRTFVQNQSIATNGSLIVPAVIERSSFVNLQNMSGESILQDRAYSNLRREPQYFAPTKVKDLDFNASTINISNSVPAGSILDGFAFELIFFYIDVCDVEPVEPQLELRKFAKLDGEKFKLLEIPVNSNQTTYQLTTSLSVGLPEDAILTGIGLNEDVSPTGRSPINSNVGQATFIQLKANSRTYVDNIPFEIAQNIIPRIYFNKFYVPVTPRRICHIDWDNSNVLIVDPSRVTTPDSVVLIGLYYVTK